MIRGRIFGIPKIAKIRERLRRRHVDFYFRVEHYALMAKQAVESEMESSLKTKAAHFQVMIHPMGKGYTLSVVPSDDVGKFLMTGTEPHTIVGTSMPVMTSGTKFANFVNHPGTDSIKEEIMECVRNGVAKAKIMESIS